MGIRGLSGYITQNHWLFLEPFELENTYLVVDGVNLYCNLYDNLDKLSGLMGGQYDLFYESIKNFFEVLLLCNIRPIVIIDGIEAMSKKDYIVRFEDKFAKYLESDAVAYPHLVGDVFLLVLRNLKIQYVKTITEADETMFAVAQTLNCPILSEDGDFFMCTTKFIHWKTLDPVPHRVEGTSRFALSCQMYNYKKLCKVFNDLNESLLPLAVAILGNKYGRSHLEDEIMSPLFERIDLVMSSDIHILSQRRIQKTLQWLSDYSSLDEAIAGVLDLVDPRHRSKILKDIQNFINGLGVCSPLAFTALGLPEEIVSKLRAGNERKLLLSQEHETKEEKPDGVGFTEQTIIDMFPKWWSEDLARGKLRGVALEMFMYSTAILKPMNENYAYPSTGIISLPILKSIYSLICSLRENDENTEVLEIISTKDKEIIREEVRVEKSSVNLRDIEKLELAERKRIIDEILGVEGVELLLELPNCWRLHMATAIFWMRQEVPPQQTKNHLLSVILMMVLGVIDDKIGFFRSQEAFCGKYAGKYREITSRDQPTLKSNGERMKKKNLREILRSVTEEECVAAAPFFISVLGLAPPERDWKTNVHIFSQFHSCLKNSQLLNSILRFPYHPIPLHRVYNGLWFYRFYLIISQHSDIEGYLRDKLQYSPTIVELFIELKNMMLKEIEGQK